MFKGTFWEVCVWYFLKVTSRMVLNEVFSLYAVDRQGVYTTSLSLPP